MDKGGGFVSTHYLVCLSKPSMEWKWLSLHSICSRDMVPALGRGRFVKLLPSILEVQDNHSIPLKIAFLPGSALYETFP